MTPSPVFVVGMNGSGTTMLLDNLGRHPDLYAFPRETRILPFLIERAQALGDLTDDEQFLAYWELVLKQGVFELANGGEPLPFPDDWRDTPRSAAGVLDRVFSILAEREGKQRWSEKTPHYVQHIEKLADIFPDAKFVHMIRDGRDSAASFHRRWRRKPELTIYRWKKVIEEGRRQARSLDDSRYMEVHYEFLTTDTEAWLRKICEFLDLQWNPVVLESSQPYLKGPVMNGMGAGDAGAKTLVPNSGKWKAHFSARKVAALEAISGKTLAECGYEPTDSEGDRDLSRLQRKRYALRDNALQFGREIWLKLTGQIERPWRVILARPGVALRQGKHNQY